MTDPNDETRSLSEASRPPTRLDLLGQTIGPYKLLQEIGEGGMGVVYMAEQTEPVKRRVALKVIKPGMDSRRVVARFEAERQALALMDHPSIAKVLDAGATDGGYPYFVMELVNGIPITEYCDQEHMPTEARLELFVSVCRAVQHAHQKGIIHRDLKPSNILVAEYDGVPVAKVIDFGVAKATAAQLTDKTLFTEFGQVIGTPEFMSPEQARRNQLDVDTRSDIYSLGIVLYQLLTGETPFGSERFRRAAWDEMAKIIREEEPMRPSQKVGSSASLEQVATDRGTSPGRLPGVMRGDLDWIVMKTLAKDRNKRYPSASELADDVGRYLAEEPVQARPPSPFDRTVKFTRRHRAPVLAGAAATAVLCAAAVGLILDSRARVLEAVERTTLLERAVGEASGAFARAELSPAGETIAWDAANAQGARVSDVLSRGPVPDEAESRARDLLDRLETASRERAIADQIERVVIEGATQSTLDSWQTMEKRMRGFFRENGFDLDEERPSSIAVKIRESPQSVQWVDLLELWIGTRGQMAALGGPRMTAEAMQPWADAIYAADDDPLRTGVRKFIYEVPRDIATLDRLVEAAELSDYSPRTLSWLANAYLVGGALEQSNDLYEQTLLLYPRDFMATFDYGLSLRRQEEWQRAARVFHRCLALRPDVAGAWQYLGEVLDQIGEDEAAAAAKRRAVELSAEKNSSEP
ncbi:MAG: serine/threonine-protein kinase [Acidobacteriota bacterium]